MASDFKINNVEQWTRNPIGSEATNFKEGSLEFFDDIIKNRYESYAPWLKGTFNFSQFKGRKVLEIGVGTGSDHVEMAKAGAIMSGVDLTPKSLELTQKNLELRGFKSNLLLGESEVLPFKDNEFDAVYSFGVIHHTPDMNKAVDEIYRVLKSGGTAFIAIYNKNSFFYWLQIIFWDQIMKLGFLRKKMDERLGEIEHSEINYKPTVQVTTKKQAQNLFKKFNRVEINIRHLNLIDMPVVSAKKLEAVSKIIFTPKILEKLSHRFGWYLVIEAVK